MVREINELKRKEEKKERNDWTATVRQELMFSFRVRENRVITAVFFPFLFPLSFFLLSRMYVDDEVRDD